MNAQAPAARRCPARASAAWRCALSLVAAFVAMTGVPALADDELPARVGRIASAQGTLYQSPDGNAGEWSEVGLNYPVAQGDNLWVDHDGRAEVDYGAGQFRLAGDTNAHVSRLDDRQFALFIATGRVIVRVRVLEGDDSVRVDTPVTQITLTRPGLYRIDVDPAAGQTTLIVREGEAEFADASGTAQVLPGQTAVLTGTDGTAADIRNRSGIDGFDAWSAARDRVYERPRENAYVSRQMVGQADLDSYGTWQTYADYGAVWFPTVAAEWAPYRFGRWTWLPRWGYTWVDDAPWGYAPFHYGRWAYIAGRWGWCPGAFVVRPIWAPALVAWYGGAGWGYSASYGGPVFGWVPLGWGEPFVPWWRGCTARCYARYNRPYAVNVAARPEPPRSHFVNWSAPGGVTAMSAAALANAKPVAINRVPVGTNTAFSPGLVVGVPAVKPAPARPVVARPGSEMPRPASTIAPLRAPAAPPAPSGAGTTIRRPAPVAPEPELRERIVAPRPAPLAERPNRPAPSLPGERAFRMAPLPAPQAAPPAPLRAPSPQVAPSSPQGAPSPAIRAAPAPAVAPRAASPSGPAPPAAPYVAPPPPAPGPVSRIAPLPTPAAGAAPPAPAGSAGRVAPAPPRPADTQK